MAVDDYRFLVAEPVPNNCRSLASLGMTGEGLLGMT